MTAELGVDTRNTYLTLSAGVEEDHEDTGSPEDDAELTEAEARALWGDR